MGKGYGQFCPLAKAAELLCERWTMIEVSEDSAALADAGISVGSAA